MKTIPSDHPALRETEAVHAPAKDEKRRPPFEPHIRRDAGAPKQAVGREGLPGSLDHDASVASTLLARKDVTALPLASTDALFGAGATIYPQGLAVVGYLSMVAAREVEGPAVGWRAPGTVASPSPGTVGVMGSYASGISVVTGASPRDFPEVASAPSHAATRETSELADTVTESTAANDVKPWLLRRLSLSGPVSQTTLRLRDYRIARGEEATHIPSLLAEAEARGHQVHRIVVNGHEIWRKDVTSPHTDSTGANHHGG